MKPTDLKESFGTLSETINSLISLGYTYDFNIKNEGFMCHKTNTILSPDDFQIDKVYRFEGSSDPDYQSILYAISSEKHSLKGTLVNGYGISANEATSKVVEKLKTNEEVDGIETKSSDSTLKRPDSERIVDASLVHMNFDLFISQIKQEPTWKTSDRNSVTLFKSEKLSIVLIALHQDAAMKPHKASGMITVQVLEGSMEFNTEQRHTAMDKGQMIVLHPNISHEVKAKTECCFLLTLVMNPSMNEDKR